MIAKSNLPTLVKRLAIAAAIACFFTLIDLLLPAAPYSALPVEAFDAGDSDMTLPQVRAKPPSLWQKVDTRRLGY